MKRILSAAALLAVGSAVSLDKTNANACPPQNIVQANTNQTIDYVSPLDYNFVDWLNRENAYAQSEARAMNTAYVFHLPIVPTPFGYTSVVDLTGTEPNVQLARELGTDEAQMMDQGLRMVLMAPADITSDSGSTGNAGYVVDESDASTYPDAGLYPYDGQPSSEVEPGLEQPADSSAVDLSSLLNADVPGGYDYNTWYMGQVADTARNESDSVSGNAGITEEMGDPDAMYPPDGTLPDWLMEEMWIESGSTVPSVYDNSDNYDNTNYGRADDTARDQTDNSSAVDGQTLDSEQVALLEAEQVASTRGEDMNNGQDEAMSGNAAEALEGYEPTINDPVMMLNQGLMEAFTTEMQTNEALAIRAREIGMDAAYDEWLNNQPNMEQPANSDNSNSEVQE